MRKSSAATERSKTLSMAKSKSEEFDRWRSDTFVALFLTMSLAEVLPNARALPAADKLRLIRLLADELDLEPDIAPLEHGRTYLLATPVFEEGAAATLLRELEAAAPG